MARGDTSLRSEIRELNLSLYEESLSITRSGEPIIASIHLEAADAELLAIEMAKAQMPEWNQLEQMKSRAELRYRRYLGSWLMMCVAAFSAYLGYPGYVLPVIFSLLSVFLWWRAGYEEQRAEREAQAQRNAFRPDWDYVRQRLEEEGLAVDILRH